MRVSARAPPATSTSGSAPPACAPGRCGSSCRRSASRSASPRWSPSSGISASSRADLRPAARRARHQPADGRPGQVVLRRRVPPARRRRSPWSAGSARSTAVAATGRVDGPRCTAPTASRPHRPAASPCSPPTPTCCPRSARPCAGGAWLNDGDRAVPGGRARRRGAPPGSAGRVPAGPAVWLGGQWFTVVGILDPVPLAPELDSRGADRLVRRRPRLLDFDGYPTTIYARCRPDAGRARSQAVLAATANPSAPNEVKVSRPSDALAAQRRHRRRPSPACCSASARWPCWSAASASPTPWSSRCWSGAPRSACAGPGRHPRARSGCSSWPSRCCCPLLGGVGRGAARARGDRRATRRRRAGPPSCRCGRLGGGLLATLLIGGAGRAVSRPCGPPGCRRRWRSRST